jgi:hypothetical protein
MGFPWKSSTYAVQPIRNFAAISNCSQACHWIKFSVTNVTSTSKVKPTHCLSRKLFLETRVFLFHVLIGATPRSFSEQTKFMQLHKIPGLGKRIK